MIRFDRISEIYANNIEAITTKTALYRKELEPEMAGDASEPNGRAWKPDAKIVRAVIAVAMETGRLVPESWKRRDESKTAHVVTLSNVHILRPTERCTLARRLHTTLGREKLEG